MKLAEFLCQPIICALVMSLVTWLILDFWQDILNKPHTRLPREIIKIVIALLNGGMSYLAEVMTQNNASPRTIALYMPIMIALEIHIIGHMKSKWGAFTVLALTSFQFITLYSVSLGITNLIGSSEFLLSRQGLVLPVTLLNIFLSSFLATIKLYKKSLKGNTRDIEIGSILSNYKSSFVLIIYACANAIAVTFLTYDAIDLLSFSVGNNITTTEICRNLIIRDTILFFSTVLMLDFQSRSIKASQRLEYERRLRNSLHRNILFRFSCNVTKGTLVESGALQISTSVDGHPALFDDISKMFIELLVHPDQKDELTHKMSIENLSSIAHTEKGFKLHMQMSPKGFINYVTLDDDSAKIYAYMDRDYIWTDLDCTVIVGDDGDTYAYFYIMDIDEQKQQEEMIKKAASTDALTGLHNRRSFRHLMEEYLSKEDNSGGSLFMFDLDYFKSVNDNLGHPKGDELLRDVANILTNTFRSYDIICRIGGDEFCAFAKGLTDNELIKKRALALNEAGRKSFALPDGREINVSFSIGIATIPGDAKDYRELYSCADSALYRAKESGRNCYKTYSSFGR